ncbi:Tat pathway signal sequence domain protein [Streptomyces sp. NPDC052016]|uniref:Tat pathway signal sequence domain protein n=1 Tax=unclassified Streptomyces TaxID=2593676 RepID=UPI0034421C64
MSGVGPVEPGEGTRAWKPPASDAPSLSRLLLKRAVSWSARHRRVALVTGSAAVLLAGAGYLHATRTPPPPSVPPPFPSQVVAIAYLGAQAPPAGAAGRSFRFGVEITTRAGPPVTVVRISQPYAGLSVSAAPAPPFRGSSGSAKTVVITMQVADCANAPRGVGLPFLDVTLRNTRAMEDHSFILGDRYAHDLSQALQVACSNEFASSPKSKNTTEITVALPASSHYADWANRPEFSSSTH